MVYLNLDASAAPGADNLPAKLLGLSSLTDDVARARAALNIAFPPQTNAVTGKRSYSYVAPSFAVQSLQSGSIAPPTGALASITAQTTLLASEATAVLARLKPLGCECDAGLESVRTLIRGELQDLPKLFASDLGPVVQRVDLTFKLLTGDDANPQLDPAAVHGQLETLRRRLGLDEAGTLTIDDEERRTDFRIFVNYVWMLHTAWRAVRAEFDGSGDDSLGIVLRRAQNHILGVRYASRELRMALAEANIGPAELVTFTLDSTPPISIADLLGWIDEVASANGLAVVAGGQDGLDAFADIVGNLLDLVCKHLKPLVEGTLQRDTGPCGRLTLTSTDRAKDAVHKLALQLTELSRAIQPASKGDGYGNE
jgi:hypothetical protein